MVSTSREDTNSTERKSSGLERMEYTWRGVVANMLPLDVYMSWSFQTTGCAIEQELHRSNGTGWYGILLDW